MQVIATKPKGAKSFFDVLRFSKLNLLFTAAFCWSSLFAASVSFPAQAEQQRHSPAVPQALEGTSSPDHPERVRLLQQQELLPHRSGGWVFPANNPPRLVWRDADEIRRLGVASPPRVRWFDAELREAPQPDHAGRWIASVEGQAPNGRPLRRAHTFFCLPEKIDASNFPDLTIRFPNFPGPNASPLLREYQPEIERTAKELFGKAVFD